jgi:type I restriction enzyme, S subunit
VQVSKAKKGYKLVDTGFGKFEEIPEEWEVQSLGDLCLKPLSGKRPKGGASQINEGIPSLGGENITKEGTVKTTNVKYIPESFFDKINVEIKQNDILLVKDGATTGRVGIIDNFYPYSKSSVNEHLFILRNKNNILAHWLYHYLFSNLGQNEIKKVFQGSAQGGINLSISKNIQIIVPPLNEQERIEQILTNINKTLEKTNQLIQKIELLKKGLMQKLFTKGIGHTKFKKIEWLFGKEIEIPEEWEMVELQNCIEPNTIITYGIVQAGPNIENGVPYIRTNDMTSDFINKEKLLKTTQDIHKKYKRTKLKEGDIICTVRANVGKFQLVPKELDNANLSRGIAKISPKTNLDNIFLYYSLNSEFIRKQLNALTKGSTFPEITMFQLRKIKTAIPSKNNEQKQIASILSNVDSQISKEKLNKANLELLKKGLMQKLLTGQIRVEV